jgi:hypothetical protein
VCQRCLFHEICRFDLDQQPKRREIALVSGDVGKKILKHELPLAASKASHARKRLSNPEAIRMAATNSKSPIQVPRQTEHSQTN